MTNQNKKSCKKYKSCKHVPCGEMMNGCEPAYCSKGSKNWGLCNMANENPKYKRYCRKTQKCTTSKRNKISPDQVYATELHQKMPYIWRHLDRKTRKQMMNLAKKPIKVLDIDYMK